MIVARLLVTEDGDQSDWGEYQLVGLPTAGDWLALAHDGFVHDLKVDRVIHMPFDPERPGTFIKRSGPTVHIRATSRVIR